MRTEGCDSLLKPMESGNWVTGTSADVVRPGSLLQSHGNQYEEIGRSVSTVIARRREL